jgi:hypothetical protein
MLEVEWNTKFLPPVDLTCLLSYNQVGILVAIGSWMPYSIERRDLLS